MDCCNYVPYRTHHQHGYGYGQEYYEHMSEYNSAATGVDFYSQHFYEDYYNSHYYPQQWPQVPTFPDYVYNPKENRMRRGFSGGSRDRSIASSPMPRSAGPRLVQSQAGGGGGSDEAGGNSWAQVQDEQLMMSPMENMRRADSAMCSGYPTSGSVNDQYLSPMTYNIKSEPNPMMTNYIQRPDPLSQMQQQADMWHTYQNITQPVSTGTTFHHADMSAVTTYQHPKTVQDNAMNENMSPDGNIPHVRLSKAKVQTSSSKQSVYSSVELTPSNVTAEEEKRFKSESGPIFEPQQNIETSVVPLHKRPRGRPPTKKTHPAPSSMQPPPPKPLPDFNEAFGSTERGRFLRPPDHLLNKNYLDHLFFEGACVKFDDYQI